MQFIPNGPDIPDALLQAHEDGRVVFFCGAGISYPARLPGFADLVDRLYKKYKKAGPTPVQQSAIDAGQFDTAINLLEADIADGRVKVRKELADILLKPNLSTCESTATHKALLMLGKDRSDCMRLVTTNFDRLFEEVIYRDSLSVNHFLAPLLPPDPKNWWDGVVYLHGLLTSEPTQDDLDRLVVSSADFGVAYLTNRWAARFVSELFHNYVVCFVGYSLNDPVLRYMMDAFAADRLPKAFAFGSFKEGEKKKIDNEWRAKNVIPILYREDKGHTFLHRTLKAWSETYRDGVLGKEQIVVEFAEVHPLASTKEDDFVGRMLWALSDSTGLPAKRFAELESAPLLEWLEPLKKPRYGHADLNRFGVASMKDSDDKLAFSLLQRPPPYSSAPLMNLVDTGPQRSQLDKVMRQLARWLTRHLHEPKLLLWLSEQGGQLHDEFIRLIETRLEQLAKGENDNNAMGLEHSSDKVPSTSMQKLWRLMLAGHVKSKSQNLDMMEWCDRFQRDGLTVTSRRQFLQILTPRVLLRRPTPWFMGQQGDSESKGIKELVDWEIVLSADHVRDSLKSLSDNERWKASLPELLPEFTSLLQEALDLMRELEGADDQRDMSFMYQPSIGEHAQNNDFYDWTVLIDLTRDAWLEMAKKSPDRAAFEAESWLNKPYPLFRRLALFAAAQE